MEIYSTNRVYCSCLYYEANFGNLLLVVIPAVCEQDGNPFGLAKKIPCVISYASFSMAVTTLIIFI